MYKLNQVQTDIRSKLDTETKDDLVHELKEKVFPKEKNNKDQKKNENKDIKIKKKYCTIKGYKNNETNVDIEAVIEKEECESTGIIIDRRE